MTNLSSLFTYKPADPYDPVDPEYELISDPRWTVQDCHLYGGGYAVNEHAPAGTPDKAYWMREWGVYKTLALAMRTCVLQAQKGEKPNA